MLFRDRAKLAVCDLEKLFGRIEATGLDTQSRVKKIENCVVDARTESDRQATEITRPADKGTVRAGGD